MFERLFFIHIFGGIIIPRYDIVESMGGYSSVYIISCQGKDYCHIPLES